MIKLKIKIMYFNITFRELLVNFLLQAFSNYILTKRLKNVFKNTFPST